MTWTDDENSAKQKKPHTKEHDSICVNFYSRKPQWLFSRWYKAGSEGGDGLRVSAGMSFVCLFLVQNSSTVGFTVYKLT